MLKFTINKFLDLRLEDGKTNVYVNNELFIHCKYILLNITLDKIEEFERIYSIDEAIERLDKYGEIPGDNKRLLFPETIFWAHCSNLQVWYENEYNTCLIHSNLAFPLLKELTKAGDTLAAKVFREEVAKRFENSNMNVRQFLLYNHYLDCLNKEELDVLLKQLKSSLIFSFTTQLKDLLNSNLANFKEIKELIDIIVFIDLVYNCNLIIHVLDKLHKKKRSQFARFLIFHLNYKEFISYKIPYGRFSTYFEEVLKYIYENYPEITQFLKTIDSGYLNSSFSLDENRSYGFVSYL